MRKHILQIYTEVDPFQFAYKPKRSTQDACLLVDELIRRHTQDPMNYARLLFLDSSSAFNTIVPIILVRILRGKLDNNTLHWILSFILNRSQFVSDQGVNSSRRTTNIGAP